MGQIDEVGRHATTVRRHKGVLSIVYHNTEVVNASPDRVILNDGGWRTVTTKARMNQASNQYDLGYQVWQHDFDWYVSWQDKTYEWPYGGELSLYSDGRAYDHSKGTLLKAVPNAS